MATQRTIVGLGEALLCERAESSEAIGLGARIAIRAARLGHEGIVLSRIGQDRAGDELLRRLEESGVVVRHLQTDPDLPTGRVVVRAGGDRVARHLEERSAYDNLQWDHDLEDVAQRADAVVHGLLTLRSGQTRSEEQRFLSASAAALKVFDLTNRGRDAPERTHVLDALSGADAAVIDAAALHAATPGARGLPLADGVRTLLREHGLVFAIVLDADDTSGDGGPSGTVYTLDAEARANVGHDRVAQLAFVVGIVHGVLRGDDPVAGVETASRIAAHAVAHPDADTPDDVLRAPR